MRTGSPIGKALVALATLAVAGATLVLGAVRAEPAGAAANCVAVIVDFRQLGGAVQTGCAKGDPANGLQALTRAGFGYAPRPRDGLICQIDARPACTDTTSTTYWSYWYRAAVSSRWVYASEGAGTHSPKPGSTEAWVWQDGGKTPPPAIQADTICPQLATTPSTPPKPTAPDPTTTPPSKPSTKPSGQPSPKPSGQPSPKPSGKPASSGPTAARGSAPPTPGGHRSATPTAGSPASSPAAGSRTPLAATQPSPGGSAGGSAGGPTDQDGGSGVLGGVAGAALGGVVVLGIGAATVIRARRGGPS